MSSEGQSTLSIASSAIGFISFAITLATFLRVTWNEYSTLVAAPSEIKYALANLKQALHEERAYLRRQYRAQRHRRRRSSTGHYPSKRPRHHPAGDDDDSSNSSTSLRVLLDTVKHLCRRFQDLERPFLVDPGEGLVGGRARGNVAAMEAARGGYNGSRVRQHASEKTADAEYWSEDERRDVAGSRGGFESEYVARFTLSHRVLWLFRRSSVDSLATQLQRMQTRRIGRETAMAWSELKAFKEDLRDLRLIPGQDSSHSDDADERVERLHIRRSGRFR